MIASREQFHDPVNPGDLVAIDLFCGGGGGSLGIRRATGRAPVMAVNHDRAAIAMHEANHPGVDHRCEAVQDVHSAEYQHLNISLVWASPDCTHFSRARSGKPKQKRIRALAWEAYRWVREARPRVFCLENVREFAKWGPLDENDKPIKARAGEHFREFVKALRDLGYAVDWRVLNCADYGTPQARHRLFLIARRDGAAIRWPKPTHGEGPGLKPYRTAAECIDWAIPAPSIFTRKRPLADKTLARIAAGMQRYVLQSQRPFIVNLTHGVRVENIDEPFKTITAAHRGEKALVAPTLIQTGYGERPGQRPRCLDIQKPLGTVVAGGSKHAVCMAFLAKHYTGVVGSSLDRPMGTVTAKDHNALVAAYLTKFYGTSQHGQSLDEPMHTVTAGAGGGHFGLVSTFLRRHGVHESPVVTIGGEQWHIADIGMRMLQPRELARAQGLPDSYILTGTKTAQTAKIGNGVPPEPVEAIIRAQFNELYSAANQIPLFAQCA